MAAPVDVFISYAPQDEALRAALAKQLAPLERAGLIRSWHAGLLEAGEDRRRAIEERLRSAQVVVLLVSADYLADDLAWEREMEPALARALAGASRVIPVRARPHDASPLPFADLAPLPSNGVAVTDWPNPDAAWADVAAGLRKAVEELAGKLGATFEQREPLPQLGVGAARVAPEIPDSRGMEGGFTRVAVAQLDYHPARVASFRALIEDPGGETPLLPASVEIVTEVQTRFERLRQRVREAYCRQLLARLDHIVASCLAWEVKILILPEASVPADILAALAHAAGPMVVVAGTHQVERDILALRLYQDLGCPEDQIPRAGQVVAPVLHAGRILSLVAKLRGDADEVVAPAERWQPIVMPEGIPGPMGVLVGSDFLHAEGSSLRALVAARLPACRFLAVPSRPSPAYHPEVPARAWEAAKRYGCPVLHASHARGGGTAFFVDEERQSDLLPFPEKPGCLRPGEEGVLVADLDLGDARPGGSARHAAPRLVRPQAAASLVYAAMPLGEAHAAFCEALFDEAKVGLEPALAHLSAHRAHLARMCDASPPTQKERLTRLLHDARFLTSTDALGALAVEVLLPPYVLPMDALRALHVEAAKEAVVRWLAKAPALAGCVTKLLSARSAAPALVAAAAPQVERERRAVRGRAQQDASPEAYAGQDLAARSGVVLTFRAHARDFDALRVSRQLVAGVLDLPVDPHLPRSEHAPEDADLDRARMQVNLPYGQASVVFAELLAAEGSPPAAAVLVSQVHFMSQMLVLRGPGVRFQGVKLFLLLRSRGELRLVTYEPTFRVVRALPGLDADGEISALYPALDDTSRQPILDAFEEWGIDVAGIDVVRDADLDPRFEAVLARFEGARETICELRRRRLAEVGGNFVEPSLAEGSAVAPAIAALDAWLAGRPLGERPDPQVAIVLGEYGSGKSTLLAEWALRRWEAPSGPRPLLVDLAGTSAASPAAALLAAARLDDTADNRAALRVGVLSGRLLPAFDGFDEMATRVTIAELPQRLADLLDTAQLSGRLVLSSRDHYFPTEGALNTALERALTASLAGPSVARRFQMCFFSEPQVRALLLAVMGDAAAVEEVWRRIQAIYDLEELCRRPILLAMIVAARHDLLGDRALRRIDLYDACLRRWLRQAGGAEPEVFTPEQKRRFAETIAVETWRSAHPAVALGALRDLLRGSFPPALFDDLPRTAEVLETTGGMFLVRHPSDAGDQFRFAHKSLQEYFLASAIARAAEAGARDLADVLSVRPITAEVAGFLTELVAPISAGSPFVTAVQRWLAARCTGRGQDPQSTAPAAANALRLLRLLGPGLVPPNADLRCAPLAGEDLRDTPLARARLEGADLCGADLRGADLRGAILAGALLRGVRLDDADLSDARAEGADFTLGEAARATLSGARLSRAVLAHSTWVGCRWDGASLDDVEATAWIARDCSALVSAAPVPVRVELEARYDDQDAFATFYRGDWSPDGLRIAAVNPRGTLLVWDACTRRLLATAAGPYWNGATRWAADGGVLVTLGAGGELRALRARDLRETLALPGPFQSVAASADGTLAALVEQAGDISIVRLSSGEEVARRPAVDAPAVDLALSPDGRFLAVTHGDGSGIVWHLREGDVWTFHDDPRRTPIASLAWHPSEDILVFSAGDFFLRCVSVSARRRGPDLLMTEPELHHLRFSPNGALLAGVTSNGTVHVWDLERRAEARDPIRPSYLAYRPTLAFSPDASKLATFGASVAVWDCETGARAFELDEAPGRTIASIAWSEAGPKLVCGIFGEDLPTIVDCASGRLYPSSVPKPMLANAVRVGAAIHSPRPGGGRVAVGHEAGHITLEDPEAGAIAGTLHGHEACVFQLAWSADGTRLASLDARNVLAIWDAEQARLLVTITLDATAALVRTPGGCFDVFGSDGAALRLAVAPSPRSRARLYAPLGGLREALHRPAIVAAALCGDLSGDGGELP